MPRDPQCLFADPAASTIGGDPTMREERMSDLQAIADRVEIETLRGEFTDTVMMRD